MKAYLSAIGTSLPSHSIDQSDSAALAQELNVSERWGHALPMLYRKSGVERRGSVLLDNSQPGHDTRQTFYQAAAGTPHGPTTLQRMQAYQVHAGPLLEESCRETLRKSSILPEAITHLVTVSCTGFASPGIDHQLIDSLQLRRDVQRTHVGFMGCHGVINGIRIAKAIAESQPNSVVLVGAVELCSLHQQYCDDAQQLVANSLFADGAASLLVTSPTHQLLKVTETERWEILGSQSWMIPSTLKQMSWVVGDHGFLMSLSPEVPTILEKELAAPVSNWLETFELSLQDIHSWAIHPGGPRILDACENCLGLTPVQVQHSRDVLRRHGNMSSPTVLFILQEIDQAFRNRDSAKAEDLEMQFGVVMAFGPGLHAEMLLMKRSSSLG